MRKELKLTKQGSAPDPATSLDPVASAREAGLRYTTDADPGITRKRAGKNFRYIDPDGQAIRDERELARIKALVIPPAWSDVWICPNPRGHLQVTGRDARGRKQYRYHPRWRETRDQTKYFRMLAFGEALPGIRAQVEEDLGLPGMARQKVLATVVKILDQTFIRVGNEEYARENGSYGLTTLRNRHVKIEGSTLRFQFRGKSGVRHVAEVSDRRVARVVKRCRELPGHRLFEYIDEEGELREVDSGDVNDYLRGISGQDFTAKDFRTWAGTVLAAQALLAYESAGSATEAKHNVVETVKEVARRLGNTPAVCRKCYVHPEVIDAYLDGETISVARDLAEQAASQESSALKPEEAAVMVLLRRRLADQETQQRRKVG